MPADRAVADAVATLRRGTAFLGRDVIAGPHRPRVVGNGLRELDRFLSLLLDAAAVARGGTGAPDRHNTADKLGTYRGEAGGADRHRLRALGRSRACLFYCGGTVRRADRRGGAAMTAGWPEDPRRVALGDELTVSADELAEVCAYYDRLAADILRRA